MATTMMTAVRRRRLTMSRGLTGESSRCPRFDMGDFGASYQTWLQDVFRVAVGSALYCHDPNWTSCRSRLVDQCSILYVYCIRAISFCLQTW
jgi:hypothetical protein